MLSKYFAGFSREDLPLGWMQYSRLGFLCDGERSSTSPARIRTSGTFAGASAPHRKSLRLLAEAVGSALGTIQDPIGCQSRLSGLNSALGKSSGDMAARAEAHLVGRLPIESRVGHDGVVFCYVERDKALEGGRRDELVQEEPVVLHRSPERLDHGVGEIDFDLGRHPT